MIATASDRVMSNTEQSVNRQIHRVIEANVSYYSQHRDEIDDRLGELDQEWDVERVLQTNAASVTLVGTVFGIFGRSRWFLLPTLVGGFMLQHAIQGWCPPLAIVRRLGVRTAREIDLERYALKALRGDFKDLQEAGDPLDVIHALER